MLAWPTARRSPALARKTHSALPSTLDPPHTPGPRPHPHPHVRPCQHPTPPALAQIAAATTEVPEYNPFDGTPAPDGSAVSDGPPTWATKTAAAENKAKGTAKNAVKPKKKDKVTKEESERLNVSGCLRAAVVSSLACSLARSLRTAPPWHSVCLLRRMQPPPPVLVLGRSSCTTRESAARPPIFDGRASVRSACANDCPPQAYAANENNAEQGNKDPNYRPANWPPFPGFCKWPCHPCFHHDFRVRAFVIHRRPCARTPRAAPRRPPSAVLGTLPFASCCTPPLTSLPIFRVASTGRNPRLGLHHTEADIPDVAGVLFHPVLQHDRLFRKPRVRGLRQRRLASCESSSCAAAPWGQSASECSKPLLSYSGAHTRALLPAAAPLRPACLLLAMAPPEPCCPRATAQPWDTCPAGLMTRVPPAVSQGFAVLWFFVFSPASYLCWFQPLYQAMRKVWSLLRMRARRTGFTCCCCPMRHLYLCPFHLCPNAPG